MGIGHRIVKNTSGGTDENIDFTLLRLNTYLRRYRSTNTTIIPDGESDRVYSACRIQRQETASFLYVKERARALRIVILTDRCKEETPENAGKASIFGGFSVFRVPM